MRKAFALFVALAALSSAAHAEDCYFDVAVADLEIVEGALPKQGMEVIWTVHGEPFRPRVVLDGAGEGYVESAPAGGGVWRQGAPGNLCIAVPEPRDVTGWIFLQQHAELRMAKARFRIPASKADPKAAARFAEAKRHHYEWLASAGASGTAWFRHQLLETTGERPAEPRPRPPAREDELARTYELFTGSRALSENLQLDRAMPAGAGGEETVALDSLAGITAKEIDWKPYLEGITSERDPLARFVPDDQLGIFFGSFEAMTRLMDTADQSGTPILRAVEARTEDAGTRARYERQLCLRTDALSRLLGPQLIEAVAFTAGDPFLRTGSDVAVLFQPKDAGVLSEMLQVRRGAAAANSGVDGIEAVKGEVSGVAYEGLVSPGRRVCSYLATIGDTVVVTNSLAQLGRIAEAAQGKAGNLAEAPEYSFFRGRYERGTGETAFVVLTDAAIRRWCSARWRIGESRRVRADAALAELEAGDVAALARGEALGAPEAPWSPVPLGALERTSAGILSATYNTRAFLTPIAELEFDHVTEAEASAYRMWRDGYQRNWSNFFDPVALRLEADDRRIAADLTVMPLIANTDYAEFTGLVRGAKIAPGAGDPHEGTLLHWILAIDAASALARQGDDFLGAMVGKGASPLSWVGSSISLYVERDAFWDEATRAENPEDFVEENIQRIPIALHVEVKDAVKCALFLTIIRAFVARTAPNMVEWETLKHGEQEYVRIGPSAQVREQGGEMGRFQIFYATLPSALIVTPSETVLQRALDRHAPPPAAEEGGVRGPKPAPPAWLGDHLCMTADRSLLDLIDRIAGPEESFRAMMRRASWSNLWILNEWKRLFPDRDPVEVHERVFGVHLVCPGGGEYAWNQAWKTMESTAFGHPGEPKDGPPDMLPFAGWRSGRFGLTFEKDGLRARCELRKE